MDKRKLAIGAAVVGGVALLAFLATRQSGSGSSANEYAQYLGGGGGGGFGLNPDTAPGRVAKVIDGITKTPGGATLPPAQTPPATTPTTGPRSGIFCVQEPCVTSNDPGATSPSLGGGGRGVVGPVVTGVTIPRGFDIGANMVAAKSVYQNTAPLHAQNLRAGRILEN